MDVVCSSKRWKHFLKTLRQLREQKHHKLRMAIKAEKLLLLCFSTPVLINLQNEKFRLKQSPCRALQNADRQPNHFHLRWLPLEPTGTGPVLYSPVLVAHKRRVCGAAYRPRATPTHYYFFYSFAKGSTREKSAARPCTQMDCSVNL